LAQHGLRGQGVALGAGGFEVGFGVGNPVGGVEQAVGAGA
jgi:hypothetical protein